MFDTENTNGSSVLSGQYTPAFASFYHGMIFCQTSKFCVLRNIKRLKAVNFSAKGSGLDVWQSSEYASPHLDIEMLSWFY